MKIIKNNILVIMICIIGSVLATMATNYAFESSDVRFDNTNTDLNSVNVQDAIDETFHHATDYNEIKTAIGNSTLTTTNKTLIGGINEVNSNKAEKSTVTNATTITSVTPTFDTDLENTEANLRVINKVVVGSIIFKCKSSFSRGGNMQLVSGMPSANVNVQLPLICIAGSQEGKTGRVIVGYDGTIKAWYSNTNPIAGNTYMIPVTYIAN